ncbi:MAG: carboxynorspermidine decarboxylase [Eubacteriales bacterium]|nr:carboxynorspermidine decarboxylase [Eubacteriales bacterium]
MKTNNVVTYGQDDDILNPRKLFKELNRPAAEDLPLFDVPTPYYLIDLRALEDNLRFLNQIMEVSGCKILLAQKAFSCFPLYPLIGKYLSGTAASGLYEAKLGREEMGDDSEVHVYSPAFKDSDFEKLLGLADKIVFNSLSQWTKYRDLLLEHNLSGERQISPGLRINPGYSEVEHAIYDPAAANSRLGISAEQFKEAVKSGQLEGIEGIHFHSLCEQNADVLERTLDAIEETFGAFPADLKWVNLGGGHHITRADYDVESLLHSIKRVQDKTGAEIYLEPGEAIALDTGFLISEVLDLVKNVSTTAILDTSAACHMPDVLEMPYKPHCFLVQEVSRSGSSRWYEAAEPGKLPYQIRLGGPTCLAGDIIGDYSFEVPPLPGDRIVFLDMAIYTMVKNNTFNGMPLPSIGVYPEDESFRTLRVFNYEDFKGRLG